MHEPMRIETAVTGLMVITPKLARVLVWVVFVITHLALLVALLASLWWFQISPADIKSSVSHFFQSSPATNIFEILTLLGVSVGGALWAYERTWRWLPHKLPSTFLFST
jgi:hypothetical protein